MKRQQYIGLCCKNKKYCNNGTTTQNTIILYLFVDLVHIYHVLTFACHSKLSIEFSRRDQNGSPHTAVTHGHVVNYHNAPIIHLLILDITFCMTATKSYQTFVAPIDNR